MLNYYELMDLIDINNHYAIYRINEAFSEDLGEAVKTIKGTAKTRAEAFRRYESSIDFRKDKTCPDMFGTGTTIILNPAFRSDKEFFVDYSKTALAHVNSKTPVDVDLQGAAALAKCLGFRAGKQNYIIDIEGNIYSWDLVSTIYSMVADIRGGIDYTFCYLSDGGPGEFHTNFKWLIIRSNFATGFVLPINGRGPGLIDVSFEYYRQFRTDLEKRELTAMKEEA